MTSSETPRGPGVTAPARGGTTDGLGRRVWRIEFPPGQELLNANDRIHWSAHARITRQLRSDAFLLARYMRIPPLERAHVVAEYQPPNLRRRDPANLYPSIKALVDGAICDAGVLPDDDAKHLIGPDMRLGEPYPKGRIVLIITELPTPSS